MISTADFRTGVNIEVEGDVYGIEWFQHHKPGKGGAIMRVKLRNLRTGSIIERTFKAGEKFQDVTMEKRRKQYLYNDGRNYHFMDMETYEQMSLPQHLAENVKDFLKEGDTVEVQFHQDRPIGIRVSLFLELKITHTEPGMKGDTV